ncbi:MAG: hypothetical protein QXX93_03250 [Desulfurococcaceae archaeon]
MIAGRYSRWFYAVALASALLITYVATATVFVYRGLDSHVNVEKPVVWFEDPLYSQRLRCTLRLQDQG